jgi:PBSX family phage terminase large subunit
MQNIQWCPFSDKHIDYINDALDCKMSVAEGSVRAGKTIDNCIIAQMYLETCEDKIHLASGSTIANAKLNIGYCNGFGLECLFAGRCKWGKFKDNEALYIKTKTGEKVVVFAGGGKADSYKKILGNSYGLWIATEINEHYDSDNSKESFIKVALARQVASKQIKILWDLNPCNPKHKIYTQYIDKYQKDGLIGGYNYAHFTIDDNLSISDERREEIKSMYDPNTIWYKRDIMGMRCVAEGLIYQDFADKTEKYLIKKEDIGTKYKLSHIKFGVDFGGNGSRHAFTCTGYTYGLRDIIPLKAKTYEGKITPDKLAELFVNFVKECYNTYSKGGDCYCDSAEQVLIAGLKSAVARSSTPTTIHNARKYPINQRINLTLKLMATGKLKFVERECDELVEALCQAVWNNKEGHEDERLDNGSYCVDILDSFEYSLEPHLNDLKYMV